MRQLIRQERKRAQWHIDLIKRVEPYASRDRVAHLILQRWRRIAMVEGGLTGAFGLMGVPANLLLFAYCQLAVVVAIAEAYGVALDGEAGETALLDVLGKAHGIEDLVRASPKVLGALARALALRHGLGTLGRIIPMVAAPISARLNRNELQRTGSEALRRFGNVVMIG
ncbi:MAG: EcsC family protein [Myxococcota bacterium]